MKQVPNDHSRWGDASLPAKAAAERLLSSARAYDPGVRVTLAEIEAAARGERRGRAAGVPARLLATAAAGLVLVTGGVALSRGWLALREPAVPSVTGDPASPVAHLERRRRIRTSWRSPAAGEPSRGGEGEIAVREGPAAETSPRMLDERPGDGPPPAPPPPPAARSVLMPVGSGASPEPPPASPADARPSPRAPSPAWSSPPAVSPVRGRSRLSPSVPSRPLTSPIMPPAFEAPVALGSAAGAETTAIRDALAQLRGGRNPARALEMLDDHERRFPAGLWREEAVVMRIEALLALGRSREALERFESIPQTALDRSPRLRVTRGELRARYGRCGEAKADFSAVLGVPVTEELRARAMRDLAACAK